MENNLVLNNRDLYVCDPIEIKDTIGSHIEYTLKGNLISDKIIRRYKEFDAFRNKLSEIYIGLYIPSLPHKQLIGETNKEVVDMRIEMINRFLLKIINLDYIKNTEEFNLFLTVNNEDIEKVLKKFNTLNYSDLLNKYINIFGDIPKNFNFEIVKINQQKFVDFLKYNLEKLNTSRKIIKILKNQFNKNNESYLSTINMFTLYEKEILNKLIDENNENKLIFFNPKNVNLCNKITNVQENCLNPYDKLFYSLTEIILDAESIIETFEKIMKLNETYFKYRISQKEEEKKYADSLDKLIYITTYQLDLIIQDYKKNCLVNYYKEYGNLLDTFQFNNSIINDFLNEILNNSNLY